MAMRRGEPSSVAGGGAGPLIELIVARVQQGYELDAHLQLPSLRLFGRSGLQRALSEISWLLAAVGSCLGRRPLLDVSSLPTLFKSMANKDATPEAGSSSGDLASE